MLRRVAAGILGLMVAATGSLARGAESAPDDRVVLEQILMQTYQLTSVGKKLMGLGAETDVHRAGTIVVVQRPGLYASLSRPENASTAVHGLETKLFRGDKDYEVPVGERFYIHAISVGGETVFFGLLSARTIVTPKGSGHVWMVATFYFPHETLAGADKDAVFQELDQWILPEGRTTNAGTAVAMPVSAPVARRSDVNAAASVAAVATPPVLPPAPARAPEALAPGMTREQVVAAMGVPQREVSFGGQTWLTYAGMVALLKDGKLVSVDTTGQPPAKVAIHSEPDGAEIYLDGQMIGSAPSTVEVPAGNHQISVKMGGYLEWSRDLRVLAGSEINLNAKLEKK